MGSSLSWILVGETPLQRSVKVGAAIRPHGYNPRSSLEAATSNTFITWLLRLYFLLLLPLHAAFLAFSVICIPNGSVPEAPCLASFHL